ncbi:MAG: cell envelope biogenesis protein OmpA [Rhodothermaceae bacterium]|nr:MAG: cell envelope biogenesis protein OmpA [Rhodothermaceae bacterium]
MKRHLHIALLAPSLAFLMVGAFLLSGCASMNNTGKGAAIGAGAGAVIGGVIGKTQDKTAEGAIIGAAVGGAAGAIIGRQMDKQAEELEKELEGAEVKRVGEGIEITFDAAILFDFDSAALRPEAQANLRDLAESLLKYPNTEVTIIGHTDAIGSEEYNQRLSERRANAAATYLIRLGVPPERIHAYGMGETAPIASNDTEAGRQQNRRVEVAIYASEEYRRQLEAEHGN